jgi:hypothetical protein
MTATSCLGLCHSSQSEEYIKGLNYPIDTWTSLNDFDMIYKNLVGAQLL